jgi:pyrroloquinoline quinone biosynthesis protein E
MRPYTLVAELTHRCPLRCPYCSNPVELTKDEIATADWLRVFEQAAALGVAQLHFSGGEPLLRGDLVELVRGGRKVGLYSNLITSGVPLDRERLAALRDAGLDCVQVSVQDAEASSSDRIAGARSFEQKLTAARWTRELGMALTINVVLHRENLDRIAAHIALAEQLGAHRIELANTQYHGWALANRAALLPERAQLERARDIAQAAAARLTGRMEVLFVLPDHFSPYPKACMGGWGRRYIVVAPDGVALPCHNARSISGLEWENVRVRALADIWEHSAAFERFRGEAWMPEPCKSCDRRSIDFGGCRCQAFALTGDAAATDPACSLSPQHQLIAAARTHAAAGDSGFVYRGTLRR